MYIAIDVGGTNVRIAGSKNLDSSALEDVRRFELSHDFERDFQKIIKTVGDISAEEIEAIGIGTPGAYDENKKIIISNVHNLPEWMEKPFVEKLAKQFDCSVFADNDAVMASFAEALFGQGRNSNFIYITWGTGVGGTQIKHENGLVISEKIPWQEYLSEIEKKCGGKDIAVKFGKSAEDLDENEWDIVMSDLEMCLEDISSKLGEKRIIIGGGITSKQGDRLKKIIGSLEEKGISMSISEFGDDVGLYGALALIKLKK